MLNINPKVNNSIYPPNEFNSFYKESKNSIESTGQTLSNGDEFQLAKALSIYKNSQFCVDTGSANNYVINEPLNTLQSPHEYFDGLTLLFKSTNTNTGASVIDYKSLGNKDIVINNSPLSSNDIISGQYYYLIFSSVNNNFELLHYVQIASDIDAFNKSNYKTLSPYLLSVNPLVQNFTLSYSVSGLSVVVSGGGTYKLTQDLLVSSESAPDDYYPVFKDVSNSTLSTYLDEINNKFVFPDNGNTFNKNKIDYQIRLKITYNHYAVGGANLIKFDAKIRRQVDNSIVYTFNEVIITDELAGTGKVYTSTALTYVAGVLDPYSVDGMYLEVESNGSSDRNMTVTGVQIMIVKF